MALDPALPPESARRVVLRADRTAPWGTLNRIIAACATSRIYKIAVGARSEELEGRFECWLPLTIDAAANVPWNDIVHVIDLSRIARVDNVEFVYGAE